MEHVRDMEHAKGKLIQQFELEDGNCPGRLDLIFSGTNDRLVLTASDDCCSLSWFEPLAGQPYEQMIGHYFESIEMKGEIDLPPSGVQECDQNHLVTVGFTDGTSFQFVLRNSSNGYYDGWLETDWKPDRGGLAKLE